MFAGMLFVPALALVVIVMAGYGLLATVSLFVVWFWLDLAAEITPDFSAWYSGRGLAILATIVLVAGYGLYTCLGGRRFFQERIWCDD